MNVEITYKMNKPYVCVGDDKQRHKEDKHKYGRIVADHVEASLGPFDSTWSETSLESVMRPAEQRQHRPEHAEKQTRGDRDKFEFASDLFYVYLLTHHQVPSIWN